MKMIEYMKRHSFAAFPLLLMAALVLAVWLWPTGTWPSAGVASSIRPPVAGPGPAVPQTILSVAQGQAVGAEAVWDGFRLNSGWYLAENATSGRYDMVANVTNETDVPDVAGILVQIRVGERNADLLMCTAKLQAHETKEFSCAPTGHAQYTSRWSRITISSLAQ
jgi:hypothetical protein